MFTLIRIEFRATFQNDRIPFEMTKWNETKNKIFLRFTWCRSHSSTHHFILSSPWPMKLKATLFTPISSIRFAIFKVFICHFSMILCTYLTPTCSHTFELNPIRQHTSRTDLYWINDWIFFKSEFFVLYQLSEPMIEINHRLLYGRSVNAISYSVQFPHPNKLWRMH